MSARARGRWWMVAAIAVAETSACQLVVGYEDREVVDTSEGAAPDGTADAVADAGADVNQDAAPDAPDAALGPGSLDPSFGAGGIVTTSIASGDAGANAIVLLPTGHILVAGYRADATRSVFALARYTSGGALDGTFGTAGVVTTSVGTGDATIKAVAMQGLSAIVAGSAIDTTVDPAGTPHMAVARYTATGALDVFAGAASASIISVDNGATDVATGVAIMNDQRIVLGGSSARSGKTQPVVARLTTSGARDTTLSGSGFKVLGNLAGATDENDIPYGLVLSDPVAGVLRLVGYAQQSGGAGFVAQVNGTNLDNAFGGSGWRMVDFGPSYDFLEALALSGNATVTVGTVGFGGVNPDFALARFLANGQLDTSFGSMGTGATQTDFAGGQDGAHAIAIDAKNRLVVVGETRDTAPTGTSVAVARYAANGALDTTFGTRGLVTLKVGTSAIARGVAIQSDGSIVIAGTTTSAGATSILVARLIP